MGKFSGRQSLLFFVGSADCLFGIVFIILGSDSVLIFKHGAAGVPMWTGIGFILIGIANLLSVFTSEKKPQNGFLNIDYSSLIFNLTGTLLASLLIGFYIWGTNDVLAKGTSTSLYNTALPYTYEDLTSVITTILIMAVLILIMSMMAMFYAMCGNITQGPSPGTYGPPARPHTGMYDGPYGLPPSYMYKQ